MFSNQYLKRCPPTLCWDCAKACGGCSWSAELKPVEGWVAEETKVATKADKFLESCRVVSCPEFQRDSWWHGQYRKEPRNGAES